MNHDFCPVYAASLTLPVVARVDLYQPGVNPTLPHTGPPPDPWRSLILNAIPGETSRANLDLVVPNPLIPSQTYGVNYATVFLSTSSCYFQYSTPGTAVKTYHGPRALSDTPFLSGNGLGDNRINFARIVCDAGKQLTKVVQTCTMLLILSELLKSDIQFSACCSWVQSQRTAM